MFDDTLAHHMVGKAAEGLDADDVLDTAVDQLDHLSGEEPAFAGLIADTHDGFRVFDQLVDAGGRIEVPALLIGSVDRTQESLYSPDRI